MIIDLTTGLTYNTEGEFLDLNNGNPYWNDQVVLTENQQLINRNYMINHLTDLTNIAYPTLINETIGSKTRVKQAEWTESLPSNNVKYILEREYYSNDDTLKAFNMIKKFEIKVNII